MSVGGFPWKTLLFVSAALNVLIVGAVIGVGVSGARLQRPVPPSEADMTVGTKAFMGALPPEKAPEIRQKLTKAWTENGTERTAARDARQDLFALVSKDEFDEPAIRAALAKVRAADEALTAKNQDAVIDVLKDLQPRQRAAALRAILRASIVQRRMGENMRLREEMGLPPRGELRALPRDDDGMRPRERLRRLREQRQLENQAPLE
jgi:uncharacterized membrane protein